MDFVLPIFPNFFSEDPASGTVFSTGYPNGLYIGQPYMCAWTFEAPKGQVVKVKVTRSGSLTFCDCCSMAFVEGKGIFGGEMKEQPYRFSSQVKEYTSGNRMLTVLFTGHPIQFANVLSTLLSFKIDYSYV